MFRALNILHMAIFAVVSRIPVALAALLLLLSTGAMLAAWLWSSTQSDLAVGFVSDHHLLPSEALVELSVLGDLDPRVVSLPQAEAGFARKDGPVWVLALGVPELRATFRIIAARSVHFVDLTVLTEPLAALPHLAPPLLLLAAAGALLLNMVLRAVLAGAAFGGAALLSTWVAIQILSPEIGNAATGLSALAGASIAATLAGSLAFRVVLAWPAGLHARLMGALTLAWALLLVPGLTTVLPGPAWALPLAGLVFAGLPTALAIGWAVLIGTGLGMENSALLWPLAALALLIQAQINQVIDHFDPNRARRRPARKRRTLPFPWPRLRLGPRREPRPRTVQANGRFNWTDLLEAPQ